MAKNEYVYTQFKQVRSSNDIADAESLSVIWLDFFLWGFRLLTDPSELLRLGKSTPTTEDTCSRRPGVKEVSKSVLVGCCTQ